MAKESYVARHALVPKWFSIGTGRASLQCVFKITAVGAGLFSGWFKVIGKKGLKNTSSC